jgi:hypothetical protein
MNDVLCIYYEYLSEKTHMAGTKNQYFNYIMLSMTLHKHLVYIFEKSWLCPNKAVQQKQQADVALLLAG